MPSDEERLRFFDQYLTRAAPTRKDEEDEERLRLSDQLIQDIGPYKPEVRYAGQESDELRAAQDKDRLIHARKILESSPIPGLRAVGEQVGTGLVSMGARGLGAIGVEGMGEYADEANRFGAAIEQAARERDERSILPEWLSRGARGAGVSMGTMIPAGATMGPYGAIAAASVQETNRAITEGRGAGKKGMDLAGYSVSQGIVEGLPAAFLQRIGLGGVESVFGKKVITTGIKEGLKRLGITALQELPEEIFTEITHKLVSYLNDVDKEISWEELGQIAKETAVQTVIATVFMGAPGVARSVQAGKAARISSEMDTYAKENRVPSRKVWRKWGLSKEFGEARTQRRAIIQEVAQQLTPPPAEAVSPDQRPLEPSAAPGAAPEAPGAVAPETAVTPEVSEIAPEPEAVQEAPMAEEPAEVVPVEQEVTPTVEAQERAIAFNKAAVTEIREEADRSELTEEAAESWDSVMDEVATDRADEKAVDVANEILAAPKKQRRQVTTYEHASMFLKAGKLLNELRGLRASRTIAIEENDRSTHARITGQIQSISEQLDRLTEATRNSRREVARSMSIGQLRLSRDSYDIVSLRDQAHQIKGPGGVISEKEDAALEGVSTDIDEFQRRVTELEQEAQVNEEKRAKEAAQEVLRKHRIKRVTKQVGKRIREKAVTEQEDIKKRLRQMGLRVNDITGIPVEGAYLIGRLGVAYVKEGAGTLVEVVERLQTAMPELALSNMDVYQALVMQDPRIQKRVRSEAAKRIANFKSQARVHIELDEMAQGIAEKAVRNEVPIPAELQALKKKLGEARKLYYKSDVDNAKLERAIEKVNRLQDDLKNDITRIKQSPKEVPPDLAIVQEKVRQLTSELRLRDELARVERQLETGEIPEKVKRAKKPTTPGLERMEIKLAQRRRDARQMIADMAPWTTGKVIKEIAYSAKALAATADISFTMRQNFWQVAAHPVMAAKGFTPSWKAFLSQNTADEIQNTLLNHMENSSLYELAGIAIQDAASPDAQQGSEVFRAKVIERSNLPGLKQWGAVMRASSRHAVTVGNLIRTSAFDQFMAKNPNATTEEMKAMADYINVSTGLGNLGSWGAVAETLNFTLFSPRFAVSRFQTPYMTYKYWSLPRVREQIAKDAVRVISTGNLAMALAALAGASLNFLDPDDPDWGKIRFGDTRIDIWGGFQQPARVIARIAIMPFREEADFSPLEIVERFAAFKVAPVISIPGEMLTGKTAIGEETTLTETMAMSVVPLAMRDIGEAWAISGPGAALSTGALAALGVGVGTYKDSQIRTRKRIRNLRQAEKYGEANQLMREWNQENPKNRIVTVKK